MGEQIRANQNKISTSTSTLTLTSTRRRRIGSNRTERGTEGLAERREERQARHRIASHRIEGSAKTHSTRVQFSSVHNETRQGKTDINTLGKEGKRRIGMDGDMGCLAADGNVKCNGAVQ